MEGPRQPHEGEWHKLVRFLDKNLRSEAEWSITDEYPTVLNPKNRHNVRIIIEDEKILSHAVLKPLIVKTPQMILKIGAIGSVVTDETHRGKGLSTKVLEECLTLASSQQCDIAILWTNLYDFYRKMGFELCGSEVSFIFQEEFPAPLTDLNYSVDPKVSAEAIVRLYANHTVASIRSSDDIRKFLSIPNSNVYTAWTKDGRLAAYAIEGKGIDLGGYIHEWGGGVQELISLLSFIRHHKQQPMTLITPAHSTKLIEELTKLPTLINYGHLGMIKILHFQQFAVKIKKAFRAKGIVDFTVEKHGNEVVFGFANELFTLQSEADLCRILFGPVQYEELGIFSPESIAKINQVLPLKLWIWGWDSV
jgi:GNAT superfamily N-acetyltransferase